MSSNAAILSLIASKITSGNRDTTAAEVREVLSEMVDSYQNTDGLNQSSGYLGIDASGRVDVSKINSSDSNNTSQVLQGDGSWRNSHSGRATFNGTGAQTTFTVTHGGGFSPTVAIAIPGSADAARVLYTNNYTATTFDVVFLVAPVLGTGNVIINYNIS